MQKPDNLSLDRKLKVLSFMEFFNYDYHAENMKLSAGKCPLPDLDISFIYLHLQYLTNQKDLNHGLDILII